MQFIYTWMGAELSLQGLWCIPPSHFRALKILLYGCFLACRSFALGFFLAANDSHYEAECFE